MNPCDKGWRRAVLLQLQRNRERKSIAFASPVFVTAGGIFAVSHTQPDGPASHAGEWRAEHARRAKR